LALIIDTLQEIHATTCSVSEITLFKLNDYFKKPKKLMHFTIIDVTFLPPSLFEPPNASIDPTIDTTKSVH